MSTIKHLLLYIFLILSISLYGQSTDYVLKVKLKSAKDIEKKMKSEKVNKIAEKYSKKYEKKGFVQNYPKAENIELQKLYYIKGQGDKKDAIKDIKALKLFESITEDEKVLIACTNPVSVNDPYLWMNNYALNAIEAHCAWTITQGNNGILVGFADTDFELTHDDLRDKIATIGGPITDRYGHGTNTSGFACAETNNGIGVSGIAYNSMIAAERVEHTVDTVVIGSETRIIVSAWRVDIRTAVWNLHLADVPIINVSWTSSGLDSLAAQTIIDNGQVLVLAAGNDSTANNNHRDIRDIPGIITVSGVNENDMHGSTASSHHADVDLCAPGYGVTTTLIDNSYGSSSGTSLSAPLVAGTIALMLEVNPCLTPTEIEEILRETTDPIADAANFPGLIGTGRLNSYEAVKMAGLRTYENTVISGNNTFSVGYKIEIENTSIGNNSNIILNARKEVEIKGSFEIPSGSNLTINIDDNIQHSCN